MPHTLFVPVFLTVYAVKYPAEDTREREHIADLVMEVAVSSISTCF